MDTALQLRINEDNGIKLTEREISSLLEKSILVKKLTGKIKEDPMFLIWRIVALSEIPHSNQLPYTQKIINLIINILGSSVGFTLTGKKENFLPCYNAILIKAFCKLGLHLDETVKNGIEWILKYQSFERNFKTEWKETEILKHGGCLKSTPCYIGVTKSVMALHEYNKFHLEMYVEDKVRLGLEYILQHHLIRRLSNDQPISKHILDLYFPENYNVNILELLWFLSQTDKFKDPRILDAIEHIKKKRYQNDKWKVDYVYKAEGYTTFDGRSKDGEWITYLLNTVLKKHAA